MLTELDRKAIWHAAHVSMTSYIDSKTKEQLERFYECGRLAIKIQRTVE